MTQNLEESVKIVKNALEAGGVYPDAVSRNNDGHIIVRDGFFYKSGRTSEGHAHKIKKALDAAGIKHSIVDNGEHNAPFRGGASVAKSCHFYTHVKLHEETINEVSKDLLKRYVAKGDRSYDNLLDKTLDSWKSAEDNEDRPAERRKHQTNAVRLGRKADRRALSLNKADARLAEETLGEAYPTAASLARKAKAAKQARAIATGYANQKSGKWSSQSYKTEDGRWASKDVKEETELNEGVVGYKHYRFTASPKVSDNEIGSPEHVTAHPGKMKALGVHTKQGDKYGHTSHVTVTNTVTGEQSHHNVYQREWGNSESRPFVSIRHLKNVHPGHTNALKHYLSGKTKLAEETLVEKYRRATGRTTLSEASAETLVGTKGSEKASRYEMHTRMPGEASEYSSIIKTHQDGKPLQNQWGGYNTLRTGKTAYVKKHFDKLDEELDLSEASPDFRYQEWPGQKPKKAFNLSKYVENNAKRQAALKKKAVAEDVEQIDELSKTTLGSYVKKASNDVASKAVEYGTKKAERDEVDRITNRHMKYADKDTVHQALKTTSDDVEAPRVKAAKRIGGIAKAVNKLTNEEALTEAPYYSLEASKARMAKEKARAAAKEAIAAAKKNAAEARKNAKADQSGMIARHIETEVGNHYPDSDGYDAIASKLHRMGIGHHDAITHMDKAARKHLGAKSFSHYVDNFHKDAQGSN